ncbi:LAGLIDADG family homing endonuclease [Cytobacillus firmus]|uniref:LAGLIDADG family homing endonuclease n=1 Tax=Cytobacillus firmus TaxID=1399 RepID=UPI0034A3E5D7
MLSMKTFLISFNKFFNILFFRIFGVKNIGALPGCDGYRKLVKFDTERGRYLDYSILEEIRLLKEQKKKPTRDMLEKRDEIIIESYNKGMSYKEMAKLFSLTDRGIRNIAKKYNLKIRNGNEQYCINKNFFKSWTNEMAWVLGMVITDGHLSANTSPSFSISQKDIKILLKIRCLFESNHPLREPTKTTTSTILTIGSKEMVEDLKKLGLTPRKSLVIKFPDVPKEYLPHFIRGVIDGDGWVKKEGSVMNITSGSKDFAESLMKIFIGWGLNSEIRTQVTKKGTIIYRVWVIGYYSVWKLSTIIYENCGDLFVVSKREKMEKHHERISRVYDKLIKLKDFREIKYYLMYNT